MKNKAIKVIYLIILLSIVLFIYTNFEKISPLIKTNKETVSDDHFLDQFTEEFGYDDFNIENLPLKDFTSEDDKTVLNNFNVTNLGSDINTEKFGSIYYQRHTEGKFILLSFEILNKDTNERKLLFRPFIVIDSEKREYEPIITSHCGGLFKIPDYSSPALLFLKPSIPCKHETLYEVAKDTDPVSIRFEKTLIDKE